MYGANTALINKRIYHITTYAKMSSQQYKYNLLCVCERSVHPVCTGIDESSQIAQDVLTY